MSTNAVIREKILTGILPKQNCHMSWYGAGRGGSCLACDQPVLPADLEVECDLPKGGGTITMHQRCYDIWLQEWPSCGE